jgi:hypothetical protein
MSELELLYHPQLRAQEYQRAAAQQRLVKIARGENRPHIYVYGCGGEQRPASQNNADESYWQTCERLQ